MKTEIVPFHAIIPTTTPSAAKTLPQPVNPVSAAPPVTFPVGLLGRRVAIVNTRADTSDPAAASCTLTVEFTSQVCTVKGSGPQYDEFASFVSEDMTYVTFQKKVYLYEWQVRPNTEQVLGPRQPNQHTHIRHLGTNDFLIFT